MPIPTLDIPDDLLTNPKSRSRVLHELDLADLYSGFYISPKETMQWSKRVTGCQPNAVFDAYFPIDKFLDVLENNSHGYQVVLMGTPDALPQAFVYDYVEPFPEGFQYTKEEDLPQREGDGRLKQ
ncbi:hypothetical protein P691DRAFT_754405 [Macrolepiota fuliginosa MF-IS2]|uniref:Uncharacterized protein n=1 Tax=Macrolepiota fuliginosa MF-IS2 TaxID=1400762 RepID=A0A9P5XQ29_9AGAR|nr:hypothetical protein P691DRAFT_754405 [Macrolepiota fuliginosa MF-IS2]